MTEPFLPELAPHEIACSLAEFSRLTVVVVGDLFLDEYIEGEMFEISKEGPIPVVRLESRVATAGAAGNLAASIRNLGAAVRVVGIVGDDANGRTLLGELEAKGIDVSGTIVNAQRRTLTYAKIRARVENAPSREILRLDTLPDSPLSAAEEREVEEGVRRAITGASAVIVLDQIHHLITRQLLALLPDLAERHHALLHGSSRDHIGDFRGFDLITPNDREARIAVCNDANDAADIEALGRRLQESGGHAQLLLTLGAGGMALFPRHGPSRRMPTLATKVVDVTGAGDALSSAAVLGNCLGWDLGTVAWAASLAAAIAIAHVGTHHVTRSELEARLSEAPGA